MFRNRITKIVMNDMYLFRWTSSILYDSSEMRMSKSVNHTTCSDVLVLDQEVSFSPILILHTVAVCEEEPSNETEG